MGRQAAETHLIGRNVALRPIAPSDYEFLRTAELSEDLGPRWRLRGATPSPEVYAQTLWAGVTAQFAVVDRRSPTPLGVVALYNADHKHGTGWFAVADLSPGAGSTRVVQGAAIFLSYVFSTWNLRKLYVEASSFNLEQFKRVAGRLLVEEGRLHDHFFYAGQFWDLHHLAIYRDTWCQWEQRILPALLPRTD